MISEIETVEQEAVPSRGLGFLLLYALAWGGGVVAYVPLLTLILPLKVARIAPADKVALLSLATLSGAIVASLMSIAIGMISDRTVVEPRGRRPWVAGGLVMTLASYAVLHAATTWVELVLAVMAFQAALNMMLAPLGAIAADEIPDRQKGLIGGLMGAVFTFGALSGMVVTASPRFTEGVQLSIVSGLLIVCVAPFLMVSRRRGPIVPGPRPRDAVAGQHRSNLVRAWTARLLVQIAGSIFFAYLLFYFETIDRVGLSFGPRDVAGQVAWLSGAVTIILVPLAIVTGRLSDILRARKPFLLITVGMVTVGLVIMALLPRWAPAAMGYILFACGVALFLALQNAYAMQLLTTPRHRGRDMGVLNLTNTLPALIAPSLAYVLAGEGDFTGLLLVLAVLTSVALVIVFQIQDRS